MKTNIITRESLISRWEKNGFEEITVTCPDGAKATIVPMSYIDAKSVKDCDYFLVYCDLPWMGHENLDKVIDELNHHEDFVREAEADKRELRAYFDEHQKTGWDDESWGFYSDWHKDCYGYRPHGYVCGEYINPHR